MLLYTMLYIVLAYLMLFAALTNSVCLNNASFFFLLKYFLCQGYELSGEIALKNNHYYYYYYIDVYIHIYVLTVIILLCNYYICYNINCHSSTSTILSTLFSLDSFVVATIRHPRNSLVVHFNPVNLSTLLWI